MSPVSNKFKNGFNKQRKNLCIQAVEDARQASAVKIMKNREKYRQVKALFSKKKIAVLLA